MTCQQPSSPWAAIPLIAFFTAWIWLPTVIALVEDTSRRLIRRRGGTP